MKFPCALLCLPLVMVIPIALAVKTNIEIFVNGQLIASFETEIVAIDTTGSIEDITYEILTVAPTLECSKTTRAIFKWLNTRVGQIKLKFEYNGTENEASVIRLNKHEEDYGCSSFSIIFEFQHISYPERNFLIFCRLPEFVCKQIAQKFCRAHFERFLWLHKDVGLRVLSVAMSDVTIWRDASEFVAYFIESQSKLLFRKDNRNFQELRECNFWQIKGVAIEAETRIKFTFVGGLLDDYVVVWFNRHINFQFGTTMLSGYLNQQSKLVELYVKNSELKSAMAEFENAKLWDYYFDSLPEKVYKITPTFVFDEECEKQGYVYVKLRFQ